MYSSYLNRELFPALRGRGFRPAPMLLSEYVWFWLQESGRDVPSIYTEQVERLMEFCSSKQNLKEKMADLEQNYPQITGGNVRYLCDLIHRTERGISAVILITPAYANSASIIELVKKDSSVPFLHYQVDGNEELEETERRDIFLNRLEAMDQASKFTNEIPL